MTVVCYRPCPPVQDEKLNFVEAYFSERLDPPIALWASTPGTRSHSQLIEILYMSIFVLLVRLSAGVEAYLRRHSSLATPPSLAALSALVMSYSRAYLRTLSVRFYCNVIPRCGAARSVVSPLFLIVRVRQ